MKELENQYKPQIHPIQRDVPLVCLSHLASGNLGKLSDKASSIINNVAGPDIQFLFPNENDAAKAVVELVDNATGALWTQVSAKNAKDQQLITYINSLKSQGFNRELIAQTLKLHFFWGTNP